MQKLRRWTLNLFFFLILTKTQTYLFITFPYSIPASNDWNEISNDGNSSQIWKGSSLKFNAKILILYICSDASDSLAYVTYISIQGKSEGRHSMSIHSVKTKEISASWNLFDKFIFSIFGAHDSLVLFQQYFLFGI